ncbi:MAG TPA: response regulator [Nitrospirota bacterium]|nr:response regulator [Nitrospirota bacterium]
MIVPCECGAKLKIDDAKVGAQGVKVRCPRCGNILSVQKTRAEEKESAVTKPKPALSGTAPLVLVAHDSEVVRNMVRTVLVDEGFAVDTAADGLETLRKATEKRPKALVLDVGIPGIYGFEVCERLKGDKNTGDIKIVLVSSVYDMRRYKRTPDSLYGADDYIEKHHIPDYLPVKLRKLIIAEGNIPISVTAAKPHQRELPEMSRPPAREFEPSFLKPDTLTRLEQNGAEPQDVSAPVQMAGHAEGHDLSAIIPESFSLDASIFQKDECDIPRVDEADPEAVEKARRFARIIVSDIALYNQDAVIEGLKNGTFYDLLKNDVDEGRELYEKRVPSAIKSRKDYYQEAFDNFIRAQQKNVR